MWSDIKEEAHDVNPVQYKAALRSLIFVLITSALITNSIIIFADSSSKHPFALVALDVTAAIASSLG